MSIHSTDVHFLATTVHARGSASSMAGQPRGKTIVLDLSTPQGRVEDLLRLVVKADRAPLYGPITFQAHVILPSGQEKFLSRVGLHGQFNIHDAYFSRRATQQKINELSKRVLKKTNARQTNMQRRISFDCGPPFELEAELAKEINRPSEVIDDDSYVVHPFERHLSNLQGVVWSHDRLFLQRVSRTLT